MYLQKSVIAYLIAFENISISDNTCHLIAPTLTSLSRFLFPSFLSPTVLRFRAANVAEYSEDVVNIHFYCALALFLLRSHHTFFLLFTTYIFYYVLTLFLLRSHLMYFLLGLLSGIAGDSFLLQPPLHSFHLNTVVFSITYLLRHGSNVLKQVSS